MTWSLELLSCATFLLFSLRSAENSSVGRRCFADLGVVIESTNFFIMTTSMPQNALDRTALILYGSQTGNAQDIAEELGRLCERLRFATNVCELDDIDIVRHPWSARLCDVKQYLFAGRQGTG